jgi:ribosomal protein L10
MVWGAADVVALAKEVVRLAGDKQYEAFKARGGVMGGARLAPEEVEAISKWPTREEQISILVGQMLSPGAKLASQLEAAGGALASQIKQIAEKAQEEAAPAAAES